jgi:pSer/pThr/pTyr-binding forkhead associated (FHA) protein
MYLQINVSIHGTELHEYCFSETEILIGRSTECDVLLDNPGVSRTHAKLLVQGDKIMLVDLLSGNGTYLNGQRVTQAPVLPSDTIGIGKFTLTARLTNEQPSSSTPPPSVEPEEVSSTTVFLRPDETRKILQQAQGARPAAQPVIRPAKSSASQQSSSLGWVFAAGALTGLLCGWLIWG